MDSFIKIVEQKKSPVVTTIHTKQIDLIRRYIKEGRNVFICGAIGVGKSFILEKVLENTNHVELLPHHLKKESHFLPFIKPSRKCDSFLGDVVRVPHDLYFRELF